jgi:hypothetical protein
MRMLGHCNLAVVLLAWLHLGALAEAERPFAIVVVDDQTGRGVPLIELETVNRLRYVTDSNGVVAFDEPGLLGSKVFFHVRGHGYEFPQDGFGFRGRAIQTTPGGEITLRIKRMNIAERLYRITGQGIYRDSHLTGRQAPISQPVLNGLVLGSDSVVNAVFRGKLHWFWGDTLRVAYPLGNFHVPGAVSELPGHGGLDPAVGIDLSYLVDEQGFARPTCQMPGDGPTWIFGLTVLPDAAGERMFASYMKVRPPLAVYRRGIAEWNAADRRFQHVNDFEPDVPLRPDGHPLRHAVAGVDYVYFASPYPLVRVRATVEDFTNLERYEAFTCLREGSSLDEPEIDRGADGAPRYAWRRGTPPVDQSAQDKLIKAGLLADDETWLRLRDGHGGKRVKAHGGSVYWNDYRKRWVMIAVESLGTSALGEVWYAEADAPEGPWRRAVKIVTHDRYSFYNPKQHPMFDADGGRIIYFEGTYTHTFSGNNDATPRYDYNQIMYRLDLADPRLNPPE